MPICIYPSDCTDFSTNGLGVLTPVSCIVTEEEGGMYELEVVQPIDHTNRWAQLINGAIIKAPVPVRESPLYSVPEPEKPAQPAQPETVERNVWEVTGTTVGEYMRDGPGTGYKTHGWLVNGERVTEIGSQMVGSRKWLHVIVQKNGRDCWMSTKWLKQVSTVTETLDGQQVAPPTSTTERSVTPRQSREQLFRIYSVERDTKEQTVTAHAMHIFYDLRANLVQLEPEKAALEADEKKKQDILDVKRPANTTLSSIWNNLAVKDHGFNLHVDESLTAEIQGDYSWKNPIECMLDPDEGILTQANARLVRDNYDIYVIPDGVRDTGVTIRRGKNLKGVTVTEDAADITTRIIPCGKDGDGKDLFLDEDPNYVDSPLIANYPMPFVQKIDYDVKVLKDPKKDDPPDGITTFKDAASARAKLKELAQKDFEENGVDLPVYGMEVDFVLLQNSPDSSEDYADLQAVFLGDTVTVIDSIIKLTAKIRVTAFEWDALTLQYTKVTLGQVDSLDQTVYSYNLPSGGISGSKIAPGSMSGNVLRDLTVQYAKFDQATIDQLIAQSLSAVEANIENLIAGHITADSITSGLIEAMTAIIENLKVGKLDADDLTAKFAQFGVLLAGTAEFDRETVQHLVAEALHLSFGEADSVFIQNLMVTYAQFAAATIGDLVVKASDGKYYHLDVDPETGNVTATEAEVTEGDLSSGHTSQGETIIDTNILAENLSTSNLFATYALINQIDAARIDVDQLFAREAFLDLLWTTQIHGDESIEMWVHNSLRKVVTEYYVSESPSIPTGGEWSETFPGTVTSDKYLWRHIKSYKGNGEYEYTSEECLTLSQGAQGPAGVGIESIEEFYGLSNSADIQPTEWQSEPMPPTPDERWLWNKETIHYDNQTTQDGEPHIIGVFGEDGKIGRGIKEIINWYLASDQSAGVTRATAGWTKEIQTTDDEKRYLWNYEETVWNDDSPHSYTNPIIIGTQGKPGQQGLQGLQGERGEDGIDGSPGKDGSDGSSINLILNSNFANSSVHWANWGSPTTRAIIEQDGKKWTHLVSSGTHWEGWQQYEVTSIPTTSQKYTASARVKGSKADQDFDFGIHWRNASGIVTQATQHFKVGTEETIVRAVFTSGEGADKFNFMVGTNQSAVTDVYFTDIKLEPGEVANPVWTPNPQDNATYFHIKYSPVESPTADQMTETPDVYIGTYVDNVKADSADPAKYQWYRFQGLQGEKGEQGIPGVGQDGKTYYLHIKYSNDGGKSFTGNGGEDSGSWIGVCTDTNEADPTDVTKYKWSGIKGDPGSQGINLLLNSSMAKNFNSWWRQNGDTSGTIVTEDGYPCLHMSGALSTTKMVTQSILDRINWTPDAVYTVSAMVKAVDIVEGTTNLKLCFAFSGANAAGAWLNYSGVSGVSEFFKINNQGWTKMVWCMKFAEQPGSKLDFQIYGRDFTGDIYVRDIKMEVGNVADPVWTPNPQDICYTPVQQYYLSTSATAQEGGEWTETQPAWESGKYLWERLRLVWSDGRADTYTTPQRALALEQALQNAQNAQDTAQNAQDLANQVYTVMDRYMTLTDDKGWEFHANLIDPETGEEVPSIWVSRIDERGFYVQRNDIGQYVFAACRDRCLVSNLEIGKINYAPLSNSNTEAETRSSIIIKPTSTGGIVFTAK